MEEEHRMGDGVAPTGVGVSRPPPAVPESARQADRPPRPAAVDRRPASCGDVHDVFDTVAAGCLGGVPPRPSGSELRETLRQIVRHRQAGSQAYFSYLRDHPEVPRTLAHLTETQLRTGLQDANRVTGASVRVGGLAATLKNDLRVIFRAQLADIARGKLEGAVAHLTRISRDPAMARAFVDRAPHGSRLEAIAERHAGRSNRVRRTLRDYRAEVVALRSHLVATHLAGEDVPLSTRAFQRRLGHPRPGTIGRELLDEMKNVWVELMKVAPSIDGDSLVADAMGMAQRFITDVVIEGGERARDERRALLHELGL